MAENIFINEKKTPFTGEQFHVVMTSIQKSLRQKDQELSRKKEQVASDQILSELQTI